MVRPRIYPEDYQPDPLHPLGTMQEQIAMWLRYEIDTRPKPLRYYADLAGLSATGVSHCLNGRGISFPSAQKLAEAVGKTFQVTLITRSNALQNALRLRANDEPAQAEAET